MEKAIFLAGIHARTHTHTHTHTHTSSGGGVFLGPGFVYVLFSFVSCSTSLLRVIFIVSYNNYIAPLVHVGDHSCNKYPTSSKAFLRLDNVPPPPPFPFPGSEEEKNRNAG